MTTENNNKPPFDDDEATVKEKAPTSSNLIDDDDSVTIKLVKKPKPQKSLGSKTASAKSFLPLLLVILFFVTIYGVRSYFDRSSTVATESTENTTQQETIKKASEAKFYTLSGELITEDAFLPGSSVEARLELSEFIKGRQSLKVDIWIHTRHGRLVFFSPDHAKYNGIGDPAVDRLVIKTRLQFMPETPTGEYRILWRVVDDFSKSQITAVKTFRITPRR